MDSGGKGIKDIIQKIGFWRLGLLVIAGVILMVFSIPEGDSGTKQETGKDSGKGEEEIVIEAMERYAENREREVEELLEKVDGVGKVKVMLTLSSSEERIPLQNGQFKEEETKEGDSGGTSRDSSRYESQKENVLIQKEGEEKPYVVQVHAPVVEGVAVVAEGVDSVEKKKEIIEMIQALFRVEAHKIRVMKMH